MSSAQQFEITPETPTELALVPGLPTVELTLQQRTRHWLTSGDWQTVMPPDGSAALEIMEAARIGIPVRLLPNETAKTPNSSSTNDTDSTPPEAARVPSISSTRRAGRIALSKAQERGEPDTPYLSELTIHIFSDVRRAHVLGLVALNPDGITSTGVQRQLEELHPDDTLGDLHRDSLEHWLGMNNLVEVDDSRRTREGRHYRATGLGLELLPAAGHSVEWEGSPGYPSLRTPFGLPQGYRLDLNTGKPTLGRQRLELLRYMTEHAKEVLTAKELVQSIGSGDTLTRTLINDVFEADWLVTIPAREQPADNYPLLVPGELDFTGYHGSRFNERFAAYLTEWWRDRHEPVNLHELIHHRTLLRREVEGTPTDFKRTVFQQVALLVSQKFMAYQRRANFPKNYLALNPAKAGPITNLIGIVDGAGYATPEYQAAGLQKLFVALKAGRNP